MNEVALRRAAIWELEAALKRENQVELTTLHHFADGIYVRELHIPKGVTLTGKVHRKSTVNIITKGSILVVTEEGKRLVTAPECFVSAPGCKKAGHALEDTIWLNIHRTDETDLERIEAEFIVPENEAIEMFQMEKLETEQCPG